MRPTTLNDYRRFSVTHPYPLTKFILPLIVTLTSICFSTTGFANWESRLLGNSGPHVAPIYTPIKLGPDERETISIFERAMKSVVFITNTALRRDYWSLNTFEIPQGSGSGIIWDRQGHIVTNFHVVYGADVKVWDSDGHTH